MLSTRSTWAFSIILLTCVTRAQGQPSALAISANDEGFLCHAGRRPVFLYRFNDVKYKPYVSRLYTPSGINILRDSPHDHVHHHALMLALNVDDAEFWAEDPHLQNRPGSQVTRSIAPVADKRAGTGIRSKLDWITYENELALTEERTIISRTVDQEVTLLWWRTQLTPGPDKEAIQLTGRHYSGLGMRFVPSMDHNGRFFSSTGQMGGIVRGDERNTQCKWCAYTATVDGKPVTVALLDHPENERPMVAFTMGDGGAHFAYLAATLNLWKEPKEMKAGQPLSLIWGVALWDEEADADLVESVYRLWVKKTP
jgi:hypothetical protein